jgi:hypothetical protein
MSFAFRSFESVGTMLCGLKNISTRVTTLLKLRVVGGVEQAQSTNERHMLASSAILNLFLCEAFAEPLT